MDDNRKGPGDGAWLELDDGSADRGLGLTDGREAAQGFFGEDELIADLNFKHSTGRREQFQGSDFLLVLV